MSLDTRKLTGKYRTFYHAVRRNGAEKKEAIELLKNQFEELCTPDGSEHDGLLYDEDEDSNITDGTAVENGSHHDGRGENKRPRSPLDEEERLLLQQRNEVNLKIRRKRNKIAAQGNRDKNLEAVRNIARKVGIHEKDIVSGDVTSLVELIDARIPERAADEDHAGGFALSPDVQSSANSTPEQMQDLVHTAAQRLNEHANAIREMYARLEALRERYDETLGDRLDSLEREIVDVRPLFPRVNDLEQQSLMFRRRMGYGP